MVDPPTGWLYGFPKELPEGVTDIRQWLIDNGYPEHEADLGVKYLRQWEKQDESVKGEE